MRMAYIMMAIKTEKKRVIVKINGEGKGEQKQDRKN